MPVQSKLIVQYQKVLTVSPIEMVWTECILELDYSIESGICHEEHRSAQRL